MEIASARDGRQPPSSFTNSSAARAVDQLADPALRQTSSAPGLRGDGGARESLPPDALRSGYLPKKVIVWCFAARVHQADQGWVCSRREVISGALD